MTTPKREDDLNDRGEPDGVQPGEMAGRHSDETPEDSGARAVEAWLGLCRRADGLFWQQLGSKCNRDEEKNDE